MAKSREITGLNCDDKLSISLPLILRARFEEMYEFEKGMLQGKDIEALHDMRVASRRVQAVLKIFRSYFPQRKFKKEYLKLKSMIRALGEVRQLDVFIDTLEKYRNKLPDNEKKPIDLLLIRQNSIRTAKRKILINLCRILDKNGFKESFAQLYSSEE
jgi:CHAD domain-containing protein